MTTLLHRLRELTNERDALRARVSQLQVQLAGCGMAAVDGHTQEQTPEGAYSWSSAYQAVLELRRAHDAAHARILELEDNLLAYWAQKGAMPALTEREAVFGRIHGYLRATDGRLRLGTREEAEHPYTRQCDEWRDYRVVDFDKDTGVITVEEWS